MKQSEIIKNYLQLIGKPVEGFKLRSLQTNWGWIGSQGYRVCRKLAEQGLIERVQMGKYAGYRTKSERKYKKFKVEGTDKIVKVLI